VAVTRRPAVFLHKDGTLVEDIPYNVDPTRIRLMPDAGSALRSVAGDGYRLVVVSNQSGVARGLFSEPAVRGVGRRLRELLEAEGVELDAFLYCPHLADGSVPSYAMECQCRKPKPGLLLRAAEELSLDVGKSWMVGDILDDVEAGRAAGCRTVLVDVGNETEWVPSGAREPDVVVPSLAAAAIAIRGAGGVPASMCAVCVARRSA
jgi:D-glycero-D-manno-heptose 1,7-bisphosphate phosphatase